MTDDLSVPNPFGLAQPLDVNGSTQPQTGTWDLHYPLAGNMTAQGAQQAASDALTGPLTNHPQAGAVLRIDNHTDIVQYGGLSLRDAPSSSATTITTPNMNNQGRMNIGETVTVATPTSGRVYVEYGGQGGWVSLSHGQYLSEERTSMFPAQ